MKTLEELDACYRAMPPVAAMGIESAGWDGQRLRLRAPLAANINDKGTVFGGSMASIATLAAWGLRGWLAPRGAPPTLLVLRVFQQDAAVETLFDRVIERWRLTGNTVLIAGTDLISRTLDPDDLFTFLNGRLGERFIASPAQVPQRLADFDLQPDPDGRYRVNECYCFDGTWQAALAALVQRADVVLMDLRGFQARNQGCRHELGVLATAAHLQRVVLLFDASTDRGTALADLALAPAGRVVWVEAGRLEQKRVAQIVGALLGAGAAAGSGEVVEAAR